MEGGKGDEGVEGDREGETVFLAVDCSFGWEEAWAVGEAGMVLAGDVEDKGIARE